VPTKPFVCACSLPLPNAPDLCACCRWLPFDTYMPVGAQRGSAPTAAAGWVRSYHGCFPPASLTEGKTQVVPISCGFLASSLFWGSAGEYSIAGVQARVLGRGVLPGAGVPFLGVAPSHSLTALSLEEIRSHFASPCAARHIPPGGMLLARDSDRPRRDVRPKLQKFRTSICYRCTAVRFLWGRPRASSRYVRGLLCSVGANCAIFLPSAGGKCDHPFTTSSSPGLVE